MAVLATPGFDLHPSAQQVPTSTNYITNFDFLNQYLPDTYEKEFERYGNRTIASFLRMVGAEMPTNSDQIKWAEQGRLHIKYTKVGSAALAAATTATLQINDDPKPAGLVAPQGSTGGTPFNASHGIALRVGQTIMLVPNAGGASNKAVITAVNATLTQCTVAFYDNGGLAVAGTGVGNSDYTLFVYGSEFKKGTAGMSGSLLPTNQAHSKNTISSQIIVTAFMYLHS